MKIRINITFQLIIILLSIIAVGALIIVNQEYNKRQIQKQSRISAITSELKTLQLSHKDWFDNFKKDVYSNAQKISVNSADSCLLGIWLASNDRSQITKYIPEVDSALTQLDIVHQNLHRQAQKIVKMYNYSDAGKQKARYYFYSNLTKTKDSLDLIFNDLTQIINKQQKQLLDSANITRKRLYRALLAITFISILIIINLLLRVLSSSRKGKRLTKAIEQGDLTYKAKVLFKDELGSLIASLNEMTSMLAEKIGQIMVVAHTVAQAANELSNTAQQISNGANDQSASTEEMSAAIEQMTATISHNTDNLQKAKEFADGINDQIDRASDLLKQNTEAIDSVMEISSVISDIAYKIDLLAINASIEASRSGENSKSFSVVAAEIRKLADTTMQHAVEINKIIKSTMKLTKETSTAFEQMLEKIVTLINIIKEVAAASEEQKTSAMSINDAIQQLTSVTQQNAASAEQLAATSEELSAQAENLKDYLSFFKISEENL